MKDNEIAQALRCCAKGIGHDDACENCKVGEIQNRREYIEFAAANAIECLTADTASPESPTVRSEYCASSSSEKSVCPASPLSATR